MTNLPHMSIDPARPGVILFDNDPMTGMIAGMRAKDIARACNSYADLLKIVKDAAALMEAAAAYAPDNRVNFSSPGTGEYLKIEGLRQTLHTASQNARAAVAKAEE
jgi:hypothetical protein